MPEICANLKISSSRGKKQGKEVCLTMAMAMAMEESFLQNLAA